MQRINFNRHWEVTSRGSASLQVYEKNEKKYIDLPHDGVILTNRAHHSPSALNSGYYQDGAYEYKKVLEVSADDIDKKYLLEFDGVYMNAEVSVNRSIVAKQPNGYVGFLADLSPYIKAGTNMIKVLANASAPNTTRWYTGAGIYRDVWLRTSERLYIMPWSLTVTTLEANPARSDIEIKTRVINESGRTKKVIANYYIYDKNGSKVNSGSTFVYFQGVEGVAKTRISLQNVSLWDCDEPIMYTVKCEITADDQIYDADKVRFGIRVIQWDCEHGFRLNGKRIKIAGGCVHSDNGPLGAVSTRSVEERRVRILKNSGYNAIRTAHNPASTALLDACDKYGMLVVEEIFDCWISGKVLNDYRLYFEDWWERDLQAVIWRDMNHPSIIMWSIGNENVEISDISGGADLCHKMTEKVKNIDVSRPVTAGLLCTTQDVMGGDGLGNVMENIADIDVDLKWGPESARFVEPLDIASYNYLGMRYAYDLEKYSNRIICGSEVFSGHMFYDYWQLVKRSNRVIGNFAWTACDYIGEVGIGSCKFLDNDFDGTIGLELAYGDKYPEFVSGTGNLDICLFMKTSGYHRNYVIGRYVEPYITVLPPQYLEKNIVFLPWGWPPTENSWSFVGDEGKLTYLEIFSPDDEIELLVNGYSYGRRAAGEANKFTAHFDNVRYEPGEVEVVSYQKGKERFRTGLKTCGKPTAFKCTIENPEINTKDNDMSFITIEAVDYNGDLVPYAVDSVRCDVSDNLILAAIGSGDPYSLEPFYVNERKLFQGRMLVILKGKHGERGKGIIKISAEGYVDSVCNLDLY